ncbi:hypothetical protein QM565_21545 [Geitlerinema splendidum]|nr:hypothetical protein [Geitlerinema splendidum]
MTGKVYSLEFTKHAQKDALRLKKSGLKEKTQQLLELLQENPWKNPPPYEN